MKANYIETENGIFYDRIDDKGNLVEKAEEYYNRIKNKQNDNCKAETESEKIARLEQAVQDLSDLVIMMSHQNKGE